MLIEKDNYTLDDIQSLIDNEVEESIHIEYKSGEALDEKNPDVRAITKEVSAFANADGGFLIYGVKENNITHIPESICPVKNPKRNKEWLEQKILLITPIISGIKIYPIRINNNEELIYVVRVPKSEDCPHMASDGHYYKKRNFSSEPMEHYEVQEAFFRSKNPSLAIMSCEFEQDFYNQEFLPYFRAFIINKSSAVAKSYKINIYFYVKGDYEVKSVSLRNPNDEKVTSFIKMSSNEFRTSCRCKEDIYLNEVVTLGNFFVDFPDYNDIRNRIFIRMVLMFEGGNSELLYINSNKSLVFDSEEIDKIMKENFNPYNRDWL